MDKNEELQKWLNDDRYVTAKRLSMMFGLSSSGIWFFLSRHKIKPVKKFALGYSKGSQRFYSLETCLLARHEESVDGIADNVLLVRPVELRQLWNVSKETCNSFLRSRGLKPIKRVKVKNIHQAFYDRAECEHARPFINQSEQKEVEQVENIEELATATKHQILIEACADDFVWDKVTMKNKIMPVKNYCDERGNFVSLFKKDETVSAILAYKNEQKQLLEKCLADKNLVTTKELVKIWNLDKSAVYNKIYRLKIKPCAKIKLDNGSMWHFYKKSDCIESQQSEKVEEKQMELPKPKEQTPDIIPADTIDLFTMSELELELKQRGVELTAEVRAKINASDMPEMQHVATMLRGNAKSIAIRLSVLNEIAGELREVKKAGFNWDKWLNPEIEKKEQIKESAPDPEPFFNTEYAKEMFFLLKEVDKNIDNEDIPCEIKEIKKVFARHGSINATECRSVLKKHGYVGMTDAGYLLGMSYAEINNYQKLFLPDYLITLGYDTIAKYKTGRCTSPIWNKTRVDKHFEEIKKNNDFRLDLVKSEISRMGENSRDRLLKMSELDKTSVSEKLDRIISAAWIMGNYDKK